MVPEKISGVITLGSECGFAGNPSHTALDRHRQTVGVYQRVVPGRNKNPDILRHEDTRVRLFTAEQDHDRLALARAFGPRPSILLAEELR